MTPNENHTSEYEKIKIQAEEIKKLYTEDLPQFLLKYDLTINKADLIFEGCRQVIDNKGLEKSTPFKNMDVEDFYFFMRFMGYVQFGIQKAYPVEGNNEAFLDEIYFADKVSGNEIKLYNEVDYTTINSLMKEMEQMPPNNYLFVYGTLKRGFGNHNEFLADTNFIGSAHTKERYALYDDGLPGVKKEKRTFIHGEVYFINDTKLEHIDFLEGHPSFYKRELVPVIIDETQKVVDAWLYFCPDMEGDLIPNGNYRKNSDL